MAAVLSFAAGAAVGFTAAALYARKHYAPLRKSVTEARRAQHDPVVELDRLYLMPSAAGISYEDFDDD